VRSLNAGIELNPVAGSTYTGIIEEYHEVQGFILAQKPARIRVIGQAPVVPKNIFDMVSDGETFRIFIPPKNRFIVGPAGLERRSKKPIENLRPQHLVDALFWAELPASKLVLFEEFDDWPRGAEAAPGRYYILTLLREARGLEISRKVWFDRSDLSLARIQVYAPSGHLAADIHYTDWQPAQEAPAGPGASQGVVRYPRHIRLFRPDDDYQLDLRITKLTLNEQIAADRFQLDQPPGTELVRVGERGGEAQP
jgi:outer membrane lipoprotein-sorting protein